MPVKAWRYGMEVFTCHEDFLDGGKLVVHRQFVLRCEGGILEIGESLKPTSVTHSSPLGRHTPEDSFYCETPAEAVKRYLRVRRQALTDSIAEHRRDIRQLEQARARLKEVDPKAVKVKQYPTDWEPCDY